MATIDEVKQQIREGILLGMKLHAEGDMDGLAHRSYTSDCVLMPPDGPTTHGSELKQFFSNSDVKRYVTENDETLVEGNMAISRDNYTAYNVDGSVAGKGNSLTVWQKRDGQWKIRFDMWTNAL